MYTHIYTCPPRKGQNYIFPFKPEDQKEISLKRLRQWYHALLTEAITSSNGPVVSFDTLDKYFPNAKLDDVCEVAADNVTLTVLDSVL